MKSANLVPISLNRNGETISKEIERWLSSIFQGTGRLIRSSKQKISEHSSDHSPGSRFKVAPNVDVAETDNMIYVTVDLPGLNEKDIEVTYSEGTLFLQGERTPSVEVENIRYLHKEALSGTYSRRILLPVEVDEEKIKACYTNGVLSITLPKSQNAIESVRKIPVQV